MVKHIENKHGHKLDEQRDVIRDDLYWLAYEAANKAKHAAARAEAKQRESAARVGAAAGAEPDAHMAEAGGHGGDWQVRMGSTWTRGWTRLIIWWLFVFIVCLDTLIDIGSNVTPQQQRHTPDWESLYMCLGGWERQCVSSAHCLAD